MIARQSKVSPLGQSFWRLGGMEFLLEICRMPLAFGSGEGDGSVLCRLPGVILPQKQQSELLLMNSLWLQVRRPWHLGSATNGLCVLFLITRSQ